MRDTLGPIAEILQEAGDFEPTAKVLCEWVGVSAAPDGREAFCKLLEASPVGIACALDFSPDTKGHWFGEHKLDRDTFDRIVALATEEHRRAAVVRVSLRDNKIGGRLPAELGRLTNLMELNMAQCGLDGTLVSDPRYTGEREERTGERELGNEERSRTVPVARSRGVQAQFPSRSGI